MTQTKQTGWVIYPAGKPEEALLYVEDRAELLRLASEWAELGHDIEYRRAQPYRNLHSFLQTVGMATLLAAVFEVVALMMRAGSA
ncbi:MAG: hypothetical protein AAGJ95_17895 [Cyanobacteria bacterium J06554_11]